MSKSNSQVKWSSSLTFNKPPNYKSLSFTFALDSIKRLTLFELEFLELIFRILEFLASERFIFEIVDSFSLRFGNEFIKVKKKTIEKRMTSFFIQVYKLSNCKLSIKIKLLTIIYC